MRKANLQITGMHCASCATLITRGLTKTPGVQEANVNYSTAKALVEYDESQVTPEQLIEVVEGRGYGAIIAVGKDAYARQEKMQHDEYIKLKRLFVFTLFFAIPSAIIGMAFMWMGIEIPYADIILFALATPIQLGVGSMFYKGAWAALRNKTANMDTLIAIGTSAAYLFSVYALLFDPALGQYFEISALLIMFVLLGKLLEARAKGKTSEAIHKLMELSPKTARVVRAGKEIDISVDDVLPGDIIIVKPGEKVPIDGIVTEGMSAIDESMITGESMPVEKKKGDMVIGASINKHGSFRFKATKVGENTTLAQIVKLIEDAQGRKAPIQRFADSVSSWFVPAVILIAIATFLSWHLLLGKDVGFSLIASVAVLVIACPCALGLATPTAIMVGSGKGAKAGILIKGADALETMHRVGAVVFDKTGTLTNGKPVVTDIVPVTKGGDERALLRIAASIEANSEHPLADAIVADAKKRGVKLERASAFKAIPGHGIEARIGIVRYLFGNLALMRDKKIPMRTITARMHALEDEGKTVMVLAQAGIRSGKALGLIAVADTIKETTPQAVTALAKLGVETYMITGDNERTAHAIATQAGIALEHVFAEVLPHEKASHVKELQERLARSKKKAMRVAMVGDGINDAPALAQADIGIAMGSGTDVAMESGNVVLMRNDLLDVARAIRLSKLTMSKIKQNMFWAMAYNVLGIPIAAGALYPFTGWLLSPVIAGGAMALSSVSVVANSILLRYRTI